MLNKIKGGHKMNLIKFHRHPFYSNWMKDFENDFFKTESTGRGDSPAVNVQEDDKQFTLEMAAPGMKKDDFKINLDNQLLTISREEKEEKEEKKDNYTRREFVYSSFSRSFRLPKSIVVDKIKADYKDGILKISLPKDEKAKLTREISVN
jgi:HSP20 family protein